MLKKIALITFLISLPCLSFGMKETSVDELNALLRQAIIDGATGNAELFIEWGADVNARVPYKEWAPYSNAKPLHLAARQPHSEHSGIVELLLQYGARIDAQDGFGEMPLHEAAIVAGIFRKVDIVDMLSDLQTQDVIRP